MTDVSAFVVLVLSPSSETKLLFPTRRRFRRGGVATELKVYLMFVLVLFVLSLQSQHTHTHTHTQNLLLSREQTFSKIGHPMNRRTSTRTRWGKMNT